MMTSMLVDEIGTGIINITGTHSWLKRRNVGFENLKKAFPDSGRFWVREVTYGWVLAAQRKVPINFGLKSWHSLHFWVGFHPKNAIAKVSLDFIHDDGTHDPTRAIETENCEKPFVSKVCILTY
jgi:hypothetical protein